MAGRKTGYLQFILSIGGMLLTVICGARGVLWMLLNWSRLQDPATDHVEAFGEMWNVLRWAFLGMALFALGWLWALGSSYAIIRSAKNEAAVPPRLNR
jgi:hypothetical protein